MPRKFLLALSLVLIFISCASTPDKIITPSEEELSQQKREACAAQPELASQWGECNVQKKIAEKIPAIKACYDKELKRNDALHGDLKLKITVKSTGKVGSVQITEGSLKNKLLSNCLISQIRKIQFAKPPKGEDPVIFLPFVLDNVR